jgi:acetyl-CoA carboxylase carboxyltransferase component/biotin carboxyl carrier protein
VQDVADLPAAFARCRSEALAAFGVPDVFVEQWLPQARHIEIQVLGDGDAVVDVGERECSLQRRHQKVVEIAPSPTLGQALREELVAAALRMGAAVKYRSLGTFEFLVDAGSGAIPFAFLEVNPRLQVEHTVTEMVTGIDLVAAQIAIAGGRSLHDLHLVDAASRRPRGYAIELRINAEQPDEHGGVRSSAGRIAVFRPAGGHGVRVDTHVHAGYELPRNYDSLLAKLVVHSPSASYADAVRRAARALGDFEISGVDTNQAFLAELLSRAEFAANAVDTRFIERHAVALVAGMQRRRPSAPADGPFETAGAIGSPTAGRVVQVDVRLGDAVRRGQQVAVLEAMKMEHAVAAPHAGIVISLSIAAGDVVDLGQPLMRLEATDDDAQGGPAVETGDLDRIRPDLLALRERNAFLDDANRPAAVARRHARGMRTARENIEDLVDPGSFVEYGALAIAAQRRRRAVDDLIRETPADGIVAGIGTINSALFGAERSRTLVMAYDYTVLAGTQGAMSHKKTDRLLHLAEEWRLPVALFAEGGGGRPGDTDLAVVAGLDVPTFATWARLSGKVPRAGIVAGHCFAGNAALLGCSDVIIATQNASIGMGGPAMIEGGGLGVFRPEEVGPIDVQAGNGVVDVVVADEAAAVTVARRYLSYFQGEIGEWGADDPRELRRLVPENRLRSYDIRAVIAALCDTGSVLELREGFGQGIVTALVRIEGKPVGLYASNPRHLSGAIDAAAADKAARFMQLCDSFGLPLLALCDTPGFMVGPDIETQAQVRHVSRMFVVAGSLSVPVFMVVLRKGYGLGAMAMAGGSFHAPFFNVAWPTGEFGAMGLEGAVRLGYRRELDAIVDAAAREARYRELVAREYANGQAMNMASMLEIDAVIDPADTRGWILRGLASLPSAARAGSHRCIDTW